VAKPTTSTANRISPPNTPPTAPLVARSGLLLYQAAKTATWRSGYATVCKTVYPSSILGVASNPAGTPAPLPKPNFRHVDPAQPIPFGMNGTPIRVGGPFSMKNV
jgi:hypothetical protein